MEKGYDLIHRKRSPFPKGKARMSPNIWFVISLYAVNLQFS